jgi:hypothetical protein
MALISKLYVICISELLLEELSEENIYTHV